MTRKATQQVTFTDYDLETVTFLQSRPGGYVELTHGYITNVRDAFTPEPQRDIVKHITARLEPCGAKFLPVIEYDGRRFGLHLKPGTRAAVAKAAQTYLESLRILWDRYTVVIDSTIEAPVKAKPAKVVAPAPAPVAADPYAIALEPEWRQGATTNPAPILPPAVVSDPIVIDEELDPEDVAKIEELRAKEREAAAWRAKEAANLGVPVERITKRAERALREAAALRNEKPAAAPQATPAPAGDAQSEAVAYYGALIDSHPAAAGRLERSLQFQLASFDATLERLTGKGKTATAAAAIWLQSAKLAADAKLR